MVLDNTISKGNYAYQFRVDVLEDKKQTELSLCSMLTQEEFKDWICCLEYGATTNKPHYQCIIWHNKKYTQKEKNNIKAKYFRKNRDTTNSISFTDAKKIVNLSSYVLKEGNDIITTLTENQVKDIPRWLSKIAMKTAWSKQVEDEMLLLCSKDVYGRYPSTIHVAKLITKYYLEESHPPPTRSKLFKLLLKYHPEFSIEDYLHRINFIQN